MSRRFILVCVCVWVSVWIACTKQGSSPLSPSATGLAVPANASADGSTLKASAPVAISPTGGVKPNTPQLTLAISNGKTLFVSNVPLTYRFEVLTQAGATVYRSEPVREGSGTTSHTVVSSAMTVDQAYQWRARAEYGSLVGPWSTSAAFIAPAMGGYMQGNELYDPLTNGSTIGTIVGPVTFLPGEGIRLETFHSYVAYQLPATLTEGEFSIIARNLETNSEGNKTKLFSMCQGTLIGGCPGDNNAGIITNERRMTVEKRGDPPGVIAWRMITKDDQIDTEGAERVERSFSPNIDYLWQATWRNNFFNVRVVEGGVNGQEIYSFGKHFEGPSYDPTPHMIFLGAPIGSSGPEGASVPGAVIRQVWVSGRPRPSFANQ